MTRYPDETGSEYEYRCTACGTVLSAYQGLYWFARERTVGESTVEIPYCPECGAEELEVRRMETEC